MVFTIVNSIEFTFRKYKNMKMAIWHITTHFVVEGHIWQIKWLILQTIYYKSIAYIAIYVVKNSLYCHPG